MLPGLYVSPSPFIFAGGEGFYEIEVELINLILARRVMFGSCRTESPIGVAKNKKRFLNQNSKVWGTVFAYPILYDPVQTAHKPPHKARTCAIHT